MRTKAVPCFRDLWKTLILILRFQDLAGDSGQDTMNIPDLFQVFTVLVV